MGINTKKQLVAEKAPTGRTHRFASLSPFPVHVSYSSLRDIFNGSYR